MIPGLNPEHNIYVLLFATFMIINTDTSFILELHLKRTKVGKIKLECIFSLWKMHAMNKIGWHQPLTHPQKRAYNPNHENGTNNPLPWKEG